MTQKVTQTKKKTKKKNCHTQCGYDSVSCVESSHFSKGFYKNRTKLNKWHNIHGELKEKKFSVHLQHVTCKPESNAFNARLRLDK